MRDADLLARFMDQRSAERARESEVVTVTRDGALGVWRGKAGNASLANARVRSTCRLEISDIFFE
jgi:hypothetical protein